LVLLAKLPYLPPNGWTITRSLKVLLKCKGIGMSQTF